jgi:hypothetical protein
MRQMMGISGIHPNKIRHERELAAKAASEGEPAKSTAERK